METRAREDVVVASEQDTQRGAPWGFCAGILPNLIIFLALYSSPWVDQHFEAWLAVGILYAGPVVVGIVGLAQVRSRHTRGCGAGLILAAVITVALWFVANSIWTANVAAANTPGG